MIDINSTISSCELAYLGDAVIELLTRARLVEKGIHGAGNLNKAALGYVTAVAQSAALEKLLPALTEKETEVFKRGRNQHSASIPKSASAAQYRRATGFEALFGYLWLGGEHERAKYLFSVAYPEADTSEDSDK
ncbi:MAG: ribonuclease III [Clostridia bacterium]|jgi:ribonuclease-3 family protein|nr:ribonuclease III [Clostridia bacterium]MBQ5602304.1 ribonuclease III [Clostridia bacterium]MBR0449845.1 ribonuclease III [Clostridia bacterium]